MAPLAVFFSWPSYLTGSNKHQAPNATVLPLLCSFPQDGVWVKQHSYTLCISNTSHSSAVWQLPLSMEILTSRMRRNGLAAEGRFKWVITKRVLQHWNRLPRRTGESPQGSVQNTMGMQHLGIWLSSEHLDLMILEVFLNFNNSVIFNDDKMKSAIYEMVSRLTEYEDCCLMRKGWLAGFSQVSLWNYSDLLSKNSERKKENIHDSFLYWEISCMVEFLLKIWWLTYWKIN